MEIPTPPQPATVKTPDPESNTVTKQLIPPPLTNGVLKRHKPSHHQPPPYKECMKNHAAAMGGHAIDGCGEFMPLPASSPTYPTSLKCAACGCHRNFHRREPEESLFPSPTTVQHVIEYQPHHRHHPPPAPATVSPGNSPSPPPISSSYCPSAPHMLLALSSGVSAPPAENNHISPGSGKKRLRTKFTQDQKDKMQELAEQVGWKVHKRHEDTIFAFCNQIGVDKNVFKVWMHNNKSNSATKKQDLITNGNNNMPSAAGEGIDFIISRNNQREEHQHQLHLHNDSFSTGANVICPKGSSTSS